MLPESHVQRMLRSLGTSPAIRIIAMAFVVLFVVLRWDPHRGFTGLMRFGERLTERQLPAIRPLPIAPSPGDGYDGQFYAQVAVEPHIGDPALSHALDKPSYRPRRILLPLLAHVIGGGDPWRILQVYALLNLVAWLALALVLWRVMPPENWRNTAAWCGVMLSVGALDSVRLALTDLPAALLLLLALLALERKRTGAMAAWFLAAGFVREISLLGGFLLRSADHAALRRPGGGEAVAFTLPGGLPVTRADVKTFSLRAVCSAPVLVWCAWLAWRLPGPVGHEGNIEWPGLAFAREVVRDAGRLLAHGYDSQWFFGIFGGLGLAAQSVYLLRQWRSFFSNPWISLGLPFAVLFWLIGVDPWIDYRAVARDCLPMTVVFNVLFVRNASAHPVWLLANITVVDGIVRMTPP